MKQSVKQSLVVVLFSVLVYPDYNTIIVVNFERLLAKSCVDITQCEDEKFSTAPLLKLY